MTKTRWIWASTATVAVLATLGAGLWFGGGPATRAGWEAAAWAAGITTALALIVTAIARAMSPQPLPTPPPSSNSEKAAANTESGDISGATVAQGQDVHVEKFSYGGDHNDFHGSTFHGPVVGKQVNQPHPGLREDGQGPKQ
ncbi:hypothetical protein [Nocardiopsis synnemataformans]|uniref:hypothetical protein n=1 Tax=Nocardiopsis synnemataformans TaxID=61305 RepID=UPI003EBB9989